MSQDDENHFNDKKGALIVEPYVGLTWQSLPDNFSPGFIHKNNLLTLFLLESLQDTQHHDVASATHSRQSLELQKIDSKLNILLGLVAQLLNHDAPLPRFQKLKFSIQGIQWLETHDCPQPKQAVLIDLFLDTENHHALKLAGVVETVKHTESGKQIQVRFDTVHNEIAEHLEKWIFRQHRREVAQRRR